MPSVVTANRLRSGAVVYLTHEGQWVATLAEASVAATPDDLAQLEGHARSALERNDVTAVYAFDVRIEHGRPIPISVREKLRAAHALPA